MQSPISSQASTERFSSRVGNYTRFRPSYPHEVITLMQEKCGLTIHSVIADVGSGTGILSKLLLENGNFVYGIEPNKEMRIEAERQLLDFNKFISIPATAENTTLPANCADILTAGQAFHWFDIEKARVEFARILKPQGWLVLIWNTRREDATPFLKAYEQLLRTYSDDYLNVRHKRPELDSDSAFFKEWNHSLATFDNRQVFDFEGLKGRLLSSSYSPEPGNPQYEPMMASLQEIFDKYKVNGQVAFEYTTQVFYGRVDSRWNPPVTTLPTS
jgi:SAM-dependent methyltransferase